ncbi:MAG: NAD+ synthase [Candidatus Altiarchaeota archaeon]|nr:NAD+ synthase [Candidatus Altiarchaeota archaeon]
MGESFTIDPESLERCGKRISESIKEIVRESGAKGAVLGLSGGIDSSVVLKLARDSGTDVHAMIMPEEGMTSEADVKDAIGLAESLGAGYSVVAINRMLEAFRGEFAWKDFPNTNERTALGNVKARTRMILNYLAANLGGRIVLGTGNRTEILLGYATKYGDAGVDFQPIGGLYKTQVRKLAEIIGIPQGIMDKTPTAGLWENQTDEGELGATYEELDSILHLLTEKNLPAEKIAQESGPDIRLIERILERMERNAHKRCAPGIPEPFF